MEKLIPPNIFLIKKEEEVNLSISRYDFHLLLLKTLKEKPKICRLNFPESIIKLSEIEETYLLHTIDDMLVFCENLNEHTIDKFYKRCTYYKIPDFPLCALKVLNGENEDTCSVSSRISECKAVWEVQHSIMIQRYVVPGVDAVFKARVTLNIKKNTVTGKLIWKEADGSFKLGRLDKVTEEEITPNPFLVDQMTNLKEILQFEYSKLEIIEILADFIQDFSGMWYFINFISAKCGVIHKKTNVFKKIENKNKIEENFFNEPQEYVPKSMSLAEEAINDVYSLINSGIKRPKKKKKKMRVP